MTPDLADLVKIWAEGTEYYKVQEGPLSTLRCKHCGCFLGFVYSDYVDLDLSTWMYAADPEFFGKIDAHLHTRYHCRHINNLGKD